MRKANRGSAQDARMLTIEQAQVYTGLGRCTCRKWCEEIGAARRFGRMMRFDRIVIDAALDQLEPMKRG